MILKIMEYYLPSPNLHSLFALDPVVASKRLYLAADPATEPKNLLSRRTASELGTASTCVFFLALYWSLSVDLFEILTKKC